MINSRMLTLITNFSTLSNGTMHVYFVNIMQYTTDPCMTRRQLNLHATHNYVSTTKLICPFRKWIITILYHFVVNNVLEVKYIQLKKFRIKKSSFYKNSYIHRGIHRLSESIDQHQELWENGEECRLIFFYFGVIKRVSIKKSMFGQIFLDIKLLPLFKSKFNVRRFSWITAKSNWKNSVGEIRRSGFKRTAV